jgi:hypothetical protein
VKGTGIPGPPKTGCLGVRISPPVLMPDRLMAGQRALVPRVEVRVLVRQLGRRARLRPSLVRRVARVGTGWRLQALVAEWQTRWLEGPVAARSCGFKSRRAHSAVRACLVTTAACLPGTEAVGVRFPGQAPRDRSVQRLARDLAMVVGPVRIRSVALRRWWRNGSRARLRPVCPRDVRVRLPPSVRMESERARAARPRC